MMSLFPIATAAKATTAPPFPVFAQDWSATETINQVIWQGQYIEDPDLGLCVGQNSNAQIQVGYQKGTRYTSYSTNFSRFDDTFGDVTIVDYKGRVEVAVESATNMTCTSWCPYTGGMYPFEMVDPDATWIEETTINGKTVQHWQYKEEGPVHILFQIDNSYVDQSDPTMAIPVLEFDELTPLKQNLGQMNESWSNFKAGPQDPSLFKYTNGPLEGCPKDPNCGNSDVFHARFNRAKRQSLAQMEQLMVERQQADESLLGRSATRRRVMPVQNNAQQKARAAVPVIPQNFQSDTKDFLVLPQGQYNVVDQAGMLYWCCAIDSNCKVQTEFQMGPLYQSMDTNETRFGGPTGSPAVVTKYNEGKEYAVDGTGACTSYCPLQVGDDEPYPITIDPEAKDLGKVNIGGNAYEHFRWTDYILRVVPMDTINAFVDVSDPANPKPFIWQEDITPFGQYLATANSTYENFVGGPQPESLFTVTGADNCPLDSSCSGTSTPPLD
jgi:hypothetical protein